MKRINSIYSLVLLTGIIGFSSCEKKSDNVTPQPVITLDSISINSPQSAESGKLAGTYSVIAPYNSNVSLPFRISAQGKLEQVDYKVTGSSSFSVLNSSNNPVTTQSVPFDWVGLMTIRSGFDTDKDFNFSVNISNLTEKTFVTIQVTDKNELKFFITVIVYPTSNGPSLSGLKLYSQRATAADAGGEPNRKMFLSSSSGTAYDTTSAKVNTKIDISFADSSGTAILVSPEYTKTATKNSAGVVSLSNGLATVFMDSPIDISQASLIKLDAISFVGKPYIKIIAGKSYLFKNASGEIGIIKINSINNGSVSSNVNAEVDMDVKSYTSNQ